MPKGDLSSWEKLVVVVDELTNCDFFRVLVYSGDDTNHSNTFKANSTGKIEFTLSGNVDFLSNVTKIILSGSNWEDSKNSTWSTTPASFKVSEVYLERPDDPLAIPKDNLLKAISFGNMQNSFAKTSSSWSTLTTAIADGEAEYANGSATVESLTAAKEAIYSAVDGLALEAGYSKLTTSMFKEWDDAINPTSGSVTGSAYDLNITTTLPYGDGSVSWKKFADVSDCKRLQVVAYSGVPRFCMNRLTSDGQIAATKADSKMLDINSNNGITWATEAYCSRSGKVFTVNLEAIVDDYGYARLNCIKNQYGDPLIVTDLLLYQSKPVTVGTSLFTSFSSNKALKVQGVTAYAAKYAADKLTLTLITEIPAGEGVIIEATSADTYELPVIDAASAIDNDLLVSDGSVTGDGSTIYALANKTYGVGFYKVASGAAVPAGKAYLVIPADPDPSREFIGFGGETTGIQDANRETIANDCYYDLQGRRVAQPQKGLYIVNGKKVLVK